MTGLQRHYQPNYREAIKRIQDGALGDIVGGQVYWVSGGVWVKDRLPSMTEMEYQMRNWYYFNWLCGDHIVEQHVHNIDVANWVKGAYPTQIQGTGGREVRDGKKYGEIFDHHCLDVYKRQVLDPQLPKSEWWMTSASFVGFRLVRPLKTPTPAEIEAYYNPPLIEDY